MTTTCRRQPGFCRSLTLVTATIGIGFASMAAELPVTSPKKVGLSSPQLATVDGIVEELIAKNNLAGATVAVARHGQIAYFKAFGLRDREASAPMTEDTIFRIFSMSKAFTSAAVLMLMEEGKIGLEDPISKYIPEFKGIQVAGKNGNHPAHREPTVHDLLHHTSGLGYGWGTTSVDKAYQAARILNRNVDLRTMCAALGKIPLHLARSCAMGLGLGWALMYGWNTRTNGTRPRRWASGDGAERPAPIIGHHPRMTWWW